MKKILDGESGSRGVVIDIPNKKAVVEHCWKKDKDAQRYQLKFVYVFDVSLEETYRLAALWVNKDFQNRMRSEKASEGDLARYEGTPISVKEMYATKDREVDPMKRVVNALEKLSDEERAELIKMLTAKA
jgi:hypothetical protein